MRTLYLATVTVLSFILGGVNAQAPAWGQCGGQTWQAFTRWLLEGTYTHLQDRTHHLPSRLDVHV